MNSHVTGVVSPREEVRRGTEHGGQTTLDARRDAARGAWGGTARQRETPALTQVHGPQGEVKPLLLLV